jgi:glycosyltransferase involved in cell wall biosynthesis
VDLDRFQEVRVDVEERKKALGLNPEDPVVGAVGWLLPIKGPMFLLEAMARLWNGGRKAALIYVGKGDLEPDLKEAASKRGVSEKVKFLGWRDDVPEIMAILDILVLPSMNEGMGRVLVEAMAAGKAVVGSRVGGIKDLIKEEENGLLAIPGDVEDLSRAIERLLGEPGLRAEMGKAGRRMAEAYSVGKMVQKVDALYTSLLTEGQMPRCRCR